MGRGMAQHQALREARSQGDCVSFVVAESSSHPGQTQAQEAHIQGLGICTSQSPALSISSVTLSSVLLLSSVF